MTIKDVFVKRIWSLCSAILFFSCCTTAYAVDEKNSEAIARQILGLCQGKQVLLLGETHSSFKLPSRNSDAPFK